MNKNKKPLTVAIAQINPTVGDFDGNLRLVISRVRQAHAAGADIVIFGEMALSGYPIWDLANKIRFVDSCKKTLRRLMRSTKSLRPAIVIGFVDRKSQHKKSYNALAVVYKGRIIHLQYKTLLPTYDVFLEQIFFLSGGPSRVFQFKNWTIGTSICEDLWDADYTEKPTAQLCRQGAELIINISASPFHRNVGKIRDALVRKQSRKNKVYVVYVNQVGAQDDLIFDGRSLVATNKGQIVFQAPAFEEGLYIYRASGHRDTKTSSQGPMALIYQALVLGIRDYCRKNGFNDVVVGLSGGIDSALTATLARDALGPERVLGVTMPGPFSSDGSIKDSKELAMRLGILFREVAITPLYELGISQRGMEDQELTLAEENYQARLRGIELMYLSNKENRLLLSTGNKSELAVGYCTLYGDMCGGLSVLGDVFKTDVYRLARFRNKMGKVIPDATLTKPPSAELRPHQTDRDSLPPYDILDQILRLYIEENFSRIDIERKLRTQVSPDVIRDVLEKVDHNEYKRRQTPPTLRISHKSWFGRRMPITNKYRG